MYEKFENTPQILTTLCVLHVYFWMLTILLETLTFDSTVVKYALVKRENKLGVLTFQYIRLAA